MLRSARAYSRCNFCQGEDLRVLCRDYAAPDGKRYRFLACRACGLAAVDPIPLLDLEELDRSNQAAFYSETNRRLFAPFVRSLVEHVKSIERFVPVGRMLDLGCGAGHFLRASAGRGWKGEGVDVVQGPDRAGCDDLVIHRSPIDRFDPPHGKLFDAVNLSHVLEHLPDPASALEKARDCLRMGGILAIGVPNPRGLVHRARNLFHVLAGRLGQSRYSADLAPPYHLYAFPPRTLLGRLDRLGFRILSARTVPQGDRKLASVFQMRYQRAWSPRRALELALDAAARPLGASSLFYVYARKLVR